MLDTVDRLRDSENEELLIQCDVFLDEKQNDDDDLGSNNQLLDINSHQQVFNAVFQKVRTAASYRVSFWAVFCGFASIQPSSLLLDALVERLC